MRIDVFHHLIIACDQLDRIETLLKHLGVKMTQITDALDALATKVSAEETVLDSAVALLNGLKAQLDAALALGDPAAVVAAVQALSDKVGVDTQKLSDAVVANTLVVVPPAP